MSVFIRRFTSDPGDDVLLEIESVNILDLEPPAGIIGIGTGCVLVFGEFENGPFNTLTEVTSAQDMQAVHGGFGYTYGGTTGQNPSAVSRQADGAVAVEYWNGNGAVQLSGKKFKRLVLCRVDTSVGSVVFSRCAALLGSPAVTYAIAAAQTLIAKVNGAGALTCTWDSTKATVTGVGGGFAIVGGELLTLGYDSAADFTVQFFAGDNSIGAMISRINAAAGFTFASNSAGQIKLTGRQFGTGGQVRVVSGSAGMFGPGITGFTVAVTGGTGDVVNANAVTQAEVKTRIEADITGSKVEFLSDGTPRLSSATPITGTIEVTGGTAAALGFPVTSDAATTGTAGTIAAGTVVKTAGGLKWVTMQDVLVTAANAGPYTVKVRPATDDGSNAGTTVSTVTLLDSVLDFDAFGVNNLVVLTAALTDAQIDAAYTTAIAASVDINTVAKEVNITYAARQSNAVRRNLKANVISASAGGCVGRVTCVRPPLNTLKATAQGAAEPGVGATRADRVIYNYPGANTTVPAIQRVGVTGGPGFTADGKVDVGADGFCASVLSQLNPEENPGQATDLLTNVNGIETGANCQGFQIGDYTNFKAKGICALRMDDGNAVFQSGCTSVDPAVYPSLKNINRRRMADYIEDTLSRRTKAFGKKLGTVKRRNCVHSEIRAFLKGLAGGVNGDDQRIDSFQVVVGAKAGNTLDSIARGLYKIKISVRTLSSMDSIVLSCMIGEAVTFDELPLAA
jgi:hypothetical protein